MKNIIWQSADGRIAYFAYADDVDTQALAVAIKTAGGVAADWTAVAFDRVLPSVRQDTWRFENGDFTFVAPPQPTAYELQEIKRKLLAEAMVKRDVLLGHLERLRTRAIEANNTTARNALSTAITSLENSFNDPRAVNAIGGDIKQVLQTIKNEIGLALAVASEDTYYALLALDAL